MEQLKGMVVGLGMGPGGTGANCAFFRGRPHYPCGCRSGKDAGCGTLNFMCGECACAPRPSFTPQWEQHTEAVLLLLPGEQALVVRTRDWHGLELHS